MFPSGYAAGHGHVNSQIDGPPANLRVACAPICRQHPYGCSKSLFEIAFTEPSLTFRERSLNRFDSGIGLEQKIVDLLPLVQRDEILAGKPFQQILIDADLVSVF